MLSFLRRMFKLDPVKPAPVLDPTEVCDDCGAADAALHDLFCTRELCPFCRGQLITCDCQAAVLNLTPEEVEALEEYVDDSVEPLKTIAERWKAALEQEGRVPFRGWKLEVTADDLILMAARGEVEAVGRLLARGVPVDAVNEVGQSALMSAAGSGQVEVMEFLLSKGASASHRNERRETPLHWATRARRDTPRQANCVMPLLAHGADVDAQNEIGATPLMDAAWWGCTVSVEILLEAGAKRNMREKKGRSAEDLARERGHGEVMEMLKMG